MDEQMSTASSGDSDWEEAADDELPEAFRSLFGPEEFPSIEAALRHDSQRHGFDFAAFRRQAGLDDFETIMAVNYIRSLVAAGQDAPAQLAAALSAGQRPWKQDRFMQPVLADDAFLLHDWDEEEVAGPSSRPSGGRAAGSSAMEALAQENAVLRSTVQALAEYLPPEIAAEMFQARGNGSAAESGLASGMAALGVRQPEASSSGRDALAAPQPLQKASARADRAAVDAQYFESYSQFGIHREMLSDKARTEAYSAALERNPGTIRGATVLDVGCGTGILSLFAARAGARRVIGVDGSSVMAATATEICRANGLAAEQGGPVSILAGRLEELAELPVDKVDVIVSEWMGYALLFETMLDTVLHARDRWLRPGGAVLPDVATLYLGGAGADALGTGFWHRVYGFRMDPVAAAVRAGAQGKANVAEVPAGQVLTQAAAVRRWDVATMAAADADFSAPFELRALPQASSEACHAVVLWFDVDFSARFCREHPVTLTTSPHAPQTHWAQTVLLLREPVDLGRASGVLRGRISVARSAQHRCLDISLEYQGTSGESVACGYQIAMS